MIFAAIGSYVQLAVSFAAYLGNKRFGRSWLWWYALRVPVGIGLALLVYTLLRGGFFTSISGGGDVNPFGVAALAGLVGMFSRQASDKLADVFDQLFKSNRNASRAGKLDPSGSTAPKITSTSPTALLPSAPTPLTVTGANFVSGCKIQFNDTKLQTDFLDSTQLSATIDPGDLQDDNSIVVENPDGSSSDPYPIDVSSA